MRSEAVASSIRPMMALTFCKRSMASGKTIVRDKIGGYTVNPVFLTIT